MPFIDLEEDLAELFGDLARDDLAKLEAYSCWKESRNIDHVLRWRKNNPERYLAYKRAYYAANRERLAAKQREYNARKRALKCAMQSSTKVS